MSRIAPWRGLSVAVVLLSSLDLFIVTIAFPDLEHSFPSSSLNDLSRVLSAYAIAFAALPQHVAVHGGVRPRQRTYLVRDPRREASGCDVCKLALE